MAAAEIESSKGVSRNIRDANDHAIFASCWVLNCKQLLGMAAAEIEWSSGRSANSHVENAQAMFESSCGRNSISVLLFMAAEAIESNNGAS